MKRAREKIEVVVIQYPKILFIVDCYTEAYKPESKAILFQPYLGEESSRFIKSLIEEEGEDYTMRRIFSTLVYDTPTTEDHRILSQLCLTDTKKNSIGHFYEIEKTYMRHIGPIRLEYVCMHNDACPIAVHEKKEEEAEKTVTPPSSPRAPDCDKREVTPELDDCDPFLSDEKPYVPAFTIPLATGDGEPPKVQTVELANNNNNNNDEKPNPKPTPNVKPKVRRGGKNRNKNIRGMQSYRPQNDYYDDGPRYYSHYDNDEHYYYSHCAEASRVAEYKRRTADIFNRHYQKREYPSEK